MVAHPAVGTGNRRSILLRHIVDETLAGRADRLKGTAIAIDVFGRGSNFDPQEDSVVRTEARRLRQALDGYYAGAGEDDPVRITIPTGKYVPRFERRQTAAHGPDKAGSGGNTVETEAGALAAPDEPLPFPAVSSRLDGTNVRAAVASSAAMRRAASAIVVMAAVVVLIVFGGGLDDERGAPPSAVAPRTPSVLVAAFEASGGGAELETLAAGITAQLIADLMRFPDFRLYTYSDSLRHNETPREARDDDVDFMVSGLVRSERRRLSVVVRLVDRASGRILWSEAYMRPLEPTHLVSMQAEIAGEIASKIGQPYGAVRDEIAARIAEEAAGTTAAQMSSFACVMQAYTYRYTNNRDLYEPARACLEDAVVRDPEYAEAWAMTAYLRLDGGRFGYEARTEAERNGAYAAARAAAAHGLALDPGNVQALKALSTVEHYAGRYEESDRLARSALELNPNDPETLGQLGWRLSVRGDFVEGIPYLERAIGRSVRPPPWWFQPIALERLVAGDMEGMLVAAERGAIDGSAASDALVAIALGGLGQMEAARAALDRVAEKWPLLANDPETALAIHHVGPKVIARMVEGMEAAGWARPHL